MFLSKIHVSNTPTNPPYKPSNLKLYSSRPKTLKFPQMYVPPSCHPCFGQKRKNVSTLTTANNTTYTNHKLYHGYAFDSNHIWLPLALLTQALTWVLIWLKHTHRHAFDSTYAHPSTYTNKYTNSNTTVHRITRTHIYLRTHLCPTFDVYEHICELEHTHTHTDSHAPTYMCELSHAVSLVCFSLFGIFSQLDTYPKTPTLSVRISTHPHPNPNPNPNPSCWTYVHPQNPNPNPNPNSNPSGKGTRHRTNTKKTYLIPDSTTIFLPKRCTITLPSKIPSQIPNPSLHIPSCLTQYLQYLHSCLQLYTPD